MRTCPVCGGEYDGRILCDKCFFSLFGGRAAADWETNVISKAWQCGILIKPRSFSYGGVVNDSPTFTQPLESLIQDVERGNK